MTFDPRAVPTASPTASKIATQDLHRNVRTWQTVTNLATPAVAQGGHTLEKRHGALHATASRHDRGSVDSSIVFLISQMAGDQICAVAARHDALTVRASPLALGPGLCLVPAHKKHCESSTLTLRAPLPTCCDPRTNSSSVWIPRFGLFSNSEPPAPPGQPRPLPHTTTAPCREGGAALRCRDG